MKTAGMYVLLFISVAVPSVIISAFWHLETSLSIKLLAITLFVLLVMLVIALHEIVGLLHKLHVAQRLMFISVERKRLHPENDMPAIQVLASDIEEEESDEKVLFYFGRQWDRLLLSVFVFCGVIVLSYFLVVNWSELEALFN